MYNFKNHKSNYHTHTWLCRHASGEVIDYVNEAIKHKYTHLGMTDHAPFEFLRQNGSSRMTYDEFKNDYLKQIEVAKVVADNNNLILYTGIEMEYFPNYHHHYEMMLEDLDYMILGQHYILKDDKLVSSYDLKTLDDIIIYRDMMIAALKTGYFSLLCHPEVGFFSIKEITDEMYEALRPVIKTAVALNIPIELNGNGIRRDANRPGYNIYDFDSYRYPKPRFWQMVKEEGGKALITSDAHDPLVLHDLAMEVGYKFAEKYGVEVIEKLEFQPNRFRK